ncbi:MAG: permease [Erysipelotrichaceae bacterium]|nr:permease [Erysipelotrichaceae bacterium]
MLLKGGDFVKVVSSIWLFFQDQLLGMKWLNGFIGNGLSLLGLDMDSRLGGSVQFFLYDVIKITILLCLLIFLISYIQSYFPPERSKKILGHFHGFGANIISALLGTVTPFCSCSSIPLFIGFTSAGLPLGVTFSFLISSPMVDLGSLVLLMSIFGVKVAFAYVIVGLIIAVIGGTLIEKLRMEKYVEDFVKNAGSVDISSPTLTKKDRVRYAKEQVVGTFKKVFPYILIGVGIGAIIHNWIPEIWVERILGSDNPLGVILATLIGVPMYADIFGTIPVAEALLAKGAQLGTILSFMMAVTTLSLPSLIMLKKAVKPKLLTLFITICTLGIIAVGYLFNTFSTLFI